MQHKDHNNIDYCNISFNQKIFLHNKTNRIFCNRYNNKNVIATFKKKKKFFSCDFAI